MKYFLFVLLLFFSCGRPMEKNEQMENLVNGVRDKYKRYEDICGDTQIFEAYDFFIKENDFGLASKAALYSGCVHHERGEWDAAMECYNNAARCGKISGDSVSVAFAHYYIADLLNADDKENEAAANYKIAALWWGENPSRKARCINAVAMMKIVLSETDSALFYLDQSMRYAQVAEDEQTIASVLNNYSVVYQGSGDYVRACNCLQQALDLADSVRRPVALMNLAKAYLAQEEMDSVAKYKRLMCEAMEKVNCSPETRAAALSFFINEALVRGDYEAAFRYGQQHEDIVLQVTEEKGNNSVFEIQQKYNFELQANQNIRQLLVRQRIIIFLVVVLLLALMAIVILVSSALKKSRVVEEINSKLLELKQQSTSQHAEMQQQYDENLRNEYLRECHAIRCFEALSNDKRNPMNYKDLENVLFEGEDHWERFEKAFDVVHPGFIATIRSDIPNLTESEFRYCLLSHFNLSRQTYANTLGCSVYNIDKIRASLNNKMKNSNIKS